MPFYHNINPAIVHLGPLEIRWYGLFYLIGFGIAYLMLPWLAKKKGIKLSKEDTSDYLSYLVIGILVGGRLGHVIFYSLPYYLQNPLKIFAVWEGGMSFHGGLIGVVIAIWFFCRKKNLRYYDIGDLSAYPLALALALGRFGNFLNGELWGKVTDWSFCIDYSRSQYIANPPDGCRYPTQLLETGKNLLIFGFIWPLRKKTCQKASSCGVSSRFMAS
jgi:phosphatidylglycerol---prolipoprotein diacylglyceryl transferase